MKYEILEKVKTAFVIANADRHNKEKVQILKNNMKNALDSGILEEDMRKYVLNK